MGEGDMPQEIAQERRRTVAVVGSALGSPDALSGFPGRGREDRRVQGQRIEPCKCKPLPGVDPFDLEAGKGRLGMAGPHPQSPAVSGTEAARALPVPGRGAATPERVAAAPSGHGAICSGNGTPATQRVVPAMGPGRHGSPRGVDPSRSGQGREGHWRSFEPGCTGSVAKVHGSTTGLRFYLWKAKTASSEVVFDQGMEAGVGTCGDREDVSLARPEAHMGFMARAKRDTAARVDGARRMGELRDGVAVCASRGGPSSRCSVPNRWHVYGTSAQVSACEVVRKGLKGMVARGGIEPPTRGFSVLCSTN